MKITSISCSDISRYITELFYPKLILFLRNSDCRSLPGASETPKRAATITPRSLNTKQSRSVINRGAIVRQDLPSTIRTKQGTNYLETSRRECFSDSEFMDKSSFVDKLRKKDAVNNNPSINRPPVLLNETSFSDNELAPHLENARIYLNDPNLFKSENSTVGENISEDASQVDSTVSYTPT